MPALSLFHLPARNLPTPNPAPLLKRTPSAYTQPRTQNHKRTDSSLSNAEVLTLGQTPHIEIPASGWKRDAKPPHIEKPVKGWKRGEEFDIVDLVALGGPHIEVPASGWKRDAKAPHVEKQVKGRKRELSSDAGGEDLVVVALSPYVELPTSDSFKRDAKVVNLPPHIEKPVRGWKRDLDEESVGSVLDWKSGLLVGMVLFGVVVNLAA